MKSIVLHIARLSRIAVVILVACCFLLGQWVEVWHHHSGRTSQSNQLSISKTAASQDSISHDSCPICSGSQFLKDGLMKPISEFFASVSKSVFSFFKYLCYQVLSAILHSGRAPPTL